MMQDGLTRYVKFQSTPSARRATQVCYAGRPERHNFNPRPPRGERLRRFAGCFYAIHYFNPRPPRGERLEAHNSQVSAKIFQSTPSARRATFMSLCEVPA